MCLLENISENFERKFPGELIPSRKDMHYLVNNLKIIRLLLDKRPDNKLPLLTEEALDDVYARSETSPRNHFKRLAQETSVSVIFARMTTILFKL